MGTFDDSRMSAAQTQMSDSHNESEAQAALTPNPWEAAYLRFETPEEEIRKFIGRLNRLGARQWPSDAEIVELFCGRGNGLVAQIGRASCRDQRLLWDVSRDS